MPAVGHITAIKVLVVMHNAASACGCQHQGVGISGNQSAKRLSAVLVFLCPEPESFLQIPCRRRTTRAMMST